MPTRTFVLLLAAVLFAGRVVGADSDPDLKQLQGKWEVVELVEDGKVIPKEAT